VGKSRLLDEFRQGLAAQQVTHIHARCLSYGSAIPYLPVLDMLRANCRLAESDSPEAITAKVRVNLQEMGLDPAQGAPYLLSLLGVQAGTASVASGRPETLKAQTFAILRQLLLHNSRQQPIILAIEDVQWIDQSSEDFLALLADSLAGAPLLLLATYRPGYRPPWLEKSYATQLVLQPLTAPDSLRLVQALLQTEQVPPALVQLLLVKAEDNPFFLEELIQGLVEQGIIVRAPQGLGEEGLAQMCQGLAALRDMGIDLAMSFYLTQLAEAYGRVGRIEQGLHLLAEARTMVDKTGERYHEAELHRLHGELLLRQAVPDMQAAEARFLHARAITRRQGAKSLELRAVMSLSRLWERRGKREEARQVLAELYGWFTEGFDTADLQEARELLEQLA
jgi:hypothetical protein